MTPNLKELVDRLEIESKQAHEHICELARTGGNKWNLSIPVQDTDSDIVLSKPLQSMNTLLEVIRLQAFYLDELATRKDEGGAEGHFGQLSVGTQSEIEKLLERVK